MHTHTCIHTLIYMLVHTQIYRHTKTHIFIHIVSQENQEITSSSGLVIITQSKSQLLNLQMFAVIFGLVSVQQNFFSNITEFLKFNF